MKASNPNVTGAKGCFAAGTLVSTPHGDVPIEHLQVGDVVVAFDQYGDLQEAKITAVFCHDSDPVYQYNIWGDAVLFATPNHWVQNQYGTFACIATLTPQDMFVDIRGHLRPYISSTFVGNGTVYNLHVEHYCTFIANGIRVHNGGTNLGRIIGAKGGGKGGGGDARAPVESPNTLRSKTLATVIDGISEGEIHSIDRIYFDDVPLENEDGTRNFEGVVYDYRLGSMDQSHMPGFSQVQQELSVSVELKYNKRIIRVISQEEVDAVVVKLRIPVLMRTDSKTGDMLPYSVSARLEYRSQGTTGWTLARDISISGKNTSPYEIAFRVDLPRGKHPWEVSFMRTSADSQDAMIQNQTYWSTYTAVIDSKFAYPHTALVGFQVDAEYFGTGVPSRSYDVHGIRMLIPDNYNPWTRKYSGLWLGKFVRKWTNNPAWIMYDLLTNPRYGLGRDIRPENVDKFSLYALAQYCDELVDDGFGGKEPRFTFNGVINAREEAYHVLTMLAGAFRGMLYFGMGTVIATQDSPADPKRQFNTSNVIDGIFTYEGTGLKARHSVALVSWNNPKDGYRPDIEPYEDAEMISMYGWRPKDTTAFGCTSQGQAHRIGKWTLDSEKHETEICSFSTGLDAADVRPGDIVSVSDPHYQGARYGGRLAYVSTSMLKMDADLDFSPNEEYVITVITPDNRLTERPIINPGTLAAEVQLAAPLDPTNLPIVGSVWAIAASNLKPRLFRVLSVQETKPNIFAFSCLFHDPRKYDRVEKGLQLPEPPYSLLPTGPLLPPKNLSIVEGLYMAGGLYPRSSAVFGWQAPDDPRVVAYEVSWSRGDFLEVWTTVGQTSGLSWMFKDTSPDIYYFRVRGVDAFGRFTKWVEITQYLNGVYNPPGDVQNFRIQVFGDMATLTWDAVTDLDMARYELRFAPVVDGTVEWSSAQALIQAIPKEATSIAVQAQLGTYYIKAVDITTVYSVHAALVLNTITPNIFNMNIVERFVQDPLWLGGTECTEVVNFGNPALTLLWNADTSQYCQEGFYYFNPPQDNIFDLGGVYTSRISSAILAGGFSHTDDFFDVDDFFDLEDFFERHMGQWKVVLEMRTTNGNPYETRDFFYYEDFFGTLATPREDFFESAVEWSDWQVVAAVDVEARAFQFRLRLETLSLDVTPLVREAWVQIDMPDRIISISDRKITSIEGGSRILFSPPFMAGPAVAITIQEGLDGDWFRILNKDRFGVNLEIFDVMGAHTTRTIDAIIKGYGAQTDYIE